jgi:hypothetical protein
MISAFKKMVIEDRIKFSNDKIEGCNYLMSNQEIVMSNNNLILEMRISNFSAFGTKLQTASWALPKNSSQIESLNKFILRTWSSGIIDHILQKRTMISSAEVQESDDNYKSSGEILSLEAFQGAFSLLGFGYFLALLAFLYENFHKNKSNLMI